MNEVSYKKKWWNRNWKWVLPLLLVTVFTSTFFVMTGNAAFRYGSVFIQPNLIEHALEKARKNDQVINKLGVLYPHDFFRLLEGDVAYSNDTTKVAITVGIRGPKGKGKLDIIAYRNGQEWKYEKIVVRIKKPKKISIMILEQAQSLIHPNQ